MPEHRLRLVLRKRFHVAQLARNGRRLAPRLVERVARFLQLLLRACEHVAEFLELRTHRAQHAPYLVAALLDRQRAKAELQAVQQREEVARPAQDDAVVALHRLRHAGPRHDLGVQAFRRDEQDREVRRERRSDVLAADFFRLDAHRLGEHPPRVLRGLRIGALERLLQALPLVQREFRVDRQPARLRLAATGKADGELDALVASGNRLDVGRVLLRRERFGKKRCELHLAPGATRLHVAEHALEIAHAHRQRLHLAQAAMHLLEALRHQFERFPESLLERGLQLFVDGRAHLLELGRVVGSHDVEALLDRRAHGFERARELAAQAGGPLALLGARIGKVLADVALHVRDLRHDGIEPRAKLGRVAQRFARLLLAAARNRARAHDEHRDQRRDHHEHGHDREEPGLGHEPV